MIKPGKTLTVPVQDVLEIAGGRAGVLGMRAGDRLHCECHRAWAGISYRRYRCQSMLL